MKPSIKLVVAFLALAVASGCTPQGLTGIPGGAIMSQEGNGNLIFTAGDKGTIFLRDQPADRVIYQGPIEKGQQIKIDAGANRVTVDGKTVTTTTALRS